MNWTGGRLQRASGPADLGIARQKQHFAKVKANILKGYTNKANLLYGTKSTPTKTQYLNGRQEDIHKSPKWSVRRLAEIDILRNREATQSTDVRKAGKERQANVTRQTNEDSHFGARNQKDGHGSKRSEDHRQREDEDRTSNAGPGNATQQQRHHRRLGPTSSRQDYEITSKPAVESDLPRRIPSVQVKREYVPEEDLYDATPSPRHRKREREESGSISNPEDDRLPDEESMSTKRRRLMMKGDWVGIGFQRPPPMTFGASRQQDKVGKRRRVTDGHQARYNTKQAIITSPFVKKLHPTFVEPSSVQPSPRIKSGRNDVRISIGGKVVPPGISSSSVYSKKTGYHQHTPLSERPQTRSSDVMLLDNEEGVFCGIESHRGLVTGETKCYDTERREYYSLYVHPNLHGAHHHPKNEALVRTSSYSSASQTHGNQEAEERQSTRLVQDKVQRQSMHNQKRQQRTRLSVSDVVDSPRSAKPKNRRDVESRRPESRRKSTPIYSSSVSLQHPKPQSSKVSSILRSASTDLDGSTAAQIGRENPVVPASQILDNEAWESWLAPLQDEQSDDQEESVANHGISISPGVSAAPTYQQPGRGISSDVAYDTQSLEIFESCQDDPEAHSSPSDSLKRYRQLLGELSPSPEPDENFQEDFESEVEVDMHQAPSDQLPASPHAPEPTIRVKVQAIKHAVQEDNDDVWEQFVFGGESDDPDSESPKPASPARDGTSKYASLMRAHLAVVNSFKPSTFAALCQTGEDTAPVRKSDSSFSTSRNANASPRNPGSKDKTSPPPVEPAGSSSTREAIDSVHASGGSLHSWGSNSGQATIAATAIVRPSQRAESDDGNSRYRMQKRVTFTKPKALIGSKLDSDSSLTPEEPLHIGRRLVNGGKKDEMSGFKKRERDVCSLIDSDEELESFEED